MKHKIFVYGSLKSGFHNHNYHLNNDESRLIGPAFIQGPYTMYSLGSFPGVVDDVNCRVDSNDRGSIIHGELYEVSSNVLNSLDILEGYNAEDNSRSFYNRRLVDVHPLSLQENDEEYGECETYFLNEDPRTCTYPVVASGDWNVS